MMMFLLTGCGVVRFSSANLPDVVEYTPQQQLKALREHESGQCSALVGMAKDYLVMRDQTRAAKGVQPSGGTR